MLIYYQRSLLYFWLPRSLAWLGNVQSLQNNKAPVIRGRETLTREEGKHLWIYYQYSRGSFPIACCHWRNEII